MRRTEALFDSRAEAEKYIRELNFGGFNVLSTRYYKKLSGKVGVVIYYE